MMNNGMTKNKTSKLWLGFFFMSLILGSHTKALDLAHWNEKSLRSSNTTIWQLLSGKCSKVSNPAKKPPCKEQIKKWQNQHEEGINGKVKPIQIISTESKGFFKVVHNQYGTQKIQKYFPGSKKSPRYARNTGGLHKFHGYQIK